MSERRASLRQKSAQATAMDKSGAATPSIPKKRVSAASLLALFKAQPSPSSITRMNRSGSQRQSQPSSAVEPDKQSGIASLTPSTMAHHTSGPSDEPESTRRLSVRSEDSILSNINVTAFSEMDRDPSEKLETALVPPPARNQPARSTRATMSYAPEKVIAPSPKPRKLRSERILESDAINTTDHAARTKNIKTSVKPDTARNRACDEIITKTGSKRDAFLLHYKDYFLPLLASTNYITKLEQSHKLTQSIVPHSQLQWQPENVTAIMKPYQLKGLSFLATMYKNGMSAILGDEMGLGKTLQTLSLIQYLEESHPPPPGLSRPYLVVCPLSVLESWYNECRKWTPKLRPMRFHGNASERENLKQQASGKIDRFGNETSATKNKRTQKLHKGAGAARGRIFDDENDAGFDILITTCEVFVAEKNWFQKAFVWRYIILDEGHKIKNEKSNVSQALQTLRAEHRLLLTGTPMQNNLREMWALLHWLFPDVFPTKTADMFAEAFDLGKGKVSTAFMDNARRLLELIMIRRLKSSPDVNLGLPPKEEVLLYVPLTPMQRFWYTRLLTKAGNSLIDELFTGSKDKETKTLQIESLENEQLSQLERAVDGIDHDNDQWAESRRIMQEAIENEQSDAKQTSAYKRLLNLVMQLRKCCVHPYQIKGALPDPYMLGDHIIHASGKFIVLSRLIDELVIKQRKKILIFSGFTNTLDFCEDLLALKGTNEHESQAPFRYLRLDGQTARAKRNLDIRLFNEVSSEYRVMLISTRAGGLGLNLTAASDIVFLDEDWNPQVTIQAEARAHRIGQTKPVTIYKICTQGTVEEQMMGRIRKKLYLSAKITESMRDIHSEATLEPSSRKRKRGVTRDMKDSPEEATPQLGTTELMSLIRRGATTLTHPEIDVNEMLSWDFSTIIDKCKDRPEDPNVAHHDGTVNEKEWLAKMERVECAVLDGVKYQRQIQAGLLAPAEVSRSDRRVGKNTTVMMNGYAINKESLQCADWEAVPTMAGKDPRLAEPKREKAPPIQHQDYCQVCHDGGEVILCSGCPRIYHEDCLSALFKAKAKRNTGFHCSQHHCFDCEKNTSDAGGLIYRCRWCEKGFCEDCLDWDQAQLLGGSLPEYDMLHYETRNAWYVECHHCVEGVANDEDVAAYLATSRAKVAKEHEDYRLQQAKDRDAAIEEAQRQIRMAEEAKAAEIPPSRDETMTEATTWDASSETTPVSAGRLRKKRKISSGNLTTATVENGGFIPNEMTSSKIPSIPRQPNRRYSSSPDIHPSTKKGYLRHDPQMNDVLNDTC
ncbi:hypothetical protein AAFC00_006976 [Neodothiora populina]|uniref:ISWI chromatin-remodeling complex ATPase ISW2 n=1 Tax=Neodothiora populina TaxID=2781224 RepID=A0ABR3PBT2_9PEZI